MWLTRSLLLLTFLLFYLLPLTSCLLSLACRLVVERGAAKELAEEGCWGHGF
jgi:hypothetical protein